MDCTSNPILVDDFMYSIASTDFPGILTHDLFDSTSLFPSSFDIPTTFGTNSLPFFSNGTTQQFTLQSTQPPTLEPQRIKLLNFADYTKHVIPSTPLNPDEESALISHVLTNEGTETRNKTSRDRLPSQTYDHIISERKRRKLLSQRFHILSGMVPGLKKMDKTSVLGEAIKYLQALQERVDTLEKKLTKETVESAVLVRKSCILMEEGFSHENNRVCNSHNQSLPEIEARVCKNQCLLRVHCEKRKGIMVKILAEVEKLNLTVLHSNVSPFGNLALDITIVVEIGKESTLMAKEIVRALHSALKTAT